MSPLAKSGLAAFPMPYRADVTMRSLATTSGIVETAISRGFAGGRKSGRNDV